MVGAHAFCHRVWQLDLPWALQAVEQGESAGSGLPAKLCEAIEHAQSSGGAAELEKALASAGALVASCTERASRVNQLVQQQEEEELRMRREHGQQWALHASVAPRWPRTLPSQARPSAP